MIIWYFFIVPFIIFFHIWYQIHFIELHIIYLSCVLVKILIEFHTMLKTLYLWYELSKENGRNISAMLSFRNFVCYDQTLQKLVYNKIYISFDQPWYAMIHLWKWFKSKDEIVNTFFSDLTKTKIKSYFAHFFLKNPGAITKKDIVRRVGPFCAAPSLHK